LDTRLQDLNLIKLHQVPNQATSRAKKQKKQTQDSKILVKLHQVSNQAISSAKIKRSKNQE